MKLKWEDYEYCSELFYVLVHTDMHTCEQLSQLTVGFSFVFF